MKGGYFTELLNKTNPIEQLQNASQTEEVPPIYVQEISKQLPGNYNIHVKRYAFI